MKQGDWMKHVGVWLLCGLMVLAGCLFLWQAQQEVDSPISTAVVQTPPPGDEIVYRTQQGEKYHRGDCWHLHNAEIPLTRREAEQMGLNPCGVCNP